MRFLVDAQLPPALARWLTDNGHDADHVMNVLSADAEDAALVKYAAANGAVIVTKDADFLLLVPNPPPQLLLVTSGNASNRILLQRFASQFEAAMASLAGGSAIVEIG